MESGPQFEPPNDPPNQRIDGFGAKNALDLLKADVGRYKLFSLAEEGEINQRLLAAREFLGKTKEQHEKKHKSNGSCQQCALAAGLLQEVEDEYTLHNLRLVLRVVGKTRNKGRLAYEDLVQEGILGLREAVSRFDPDRGYRLATYAVWWIRHYVNRAVSQTGYTVRIPVHMQERINKVLWKRSKLELAGISSKNRLAVETDLSVKELDKVLQAEQLRTTSSLDNPIEEEGGKTFHDLLADHGSENAEDRVVRKQQWEMLKRIVACLPERDQWVLRRRYTEGATLREIGDELNLSRERIRQIEEKTLSQLRVAAIRKGL